MCTDLSAHDSALLPDLETCFQWMKNIAERRIEEADVIIALGNAAATRTAALAGYLFKLGVAPRIVCCGGRGRSTEKFKLPEARVMSAALLLCKINGDAVLRDETSSNTRENFERAFALLDEAKLPRERIIVVHDSGTPRRDRNLLWQQFPDYRPGNGKVALHWSWGKTFTDVALCGSFGNTIDLYANMFVGTLQRVIECTCPPRAWHWPDDPPPDVLAAYQRLRTQYPNHLKTVTETTDSAQGGNP